VTDFDGDTDTISIIDYINVIDLLPTANFTANTTQISLSNNNVQFTFTGSEGDEPATFQWDFGDGSANSTYRNPIHQYNSEGKYTVILTVTDADGDTDVIERIDYIVVQVEDLVIPGYSFGLILVFGSIGVVILYGKIQKKRLK
jgi:PKD repeat protein